MNKGAFCLFHFKCLNIKNNNNIHIFKHKSWQKRATLVLNLFEGPGMSLHIFLKLFDYCILLLNSLSMLCLTKQWTIQSIQKTQKKETVIWCTGGAYTWNRRAVYDRGLYLRTARTTEETIEVFFYFYF